MAINIRLLTENNCAEASLLFDAYRQFYGQDADLDASSAFLRERLSDKNSVVLIAYDKHKAVGFTQLYPSYSSVSIKPIWILNDLYVDHNDRRKGIATLLISSARDYALSTNAVKLIIATAPDNLVAQNLYEKYGFKKDSFIHYYLPLNK